MKPFDFLRALDDSDLDTYEIRYLLRVYRRGSSWEKLATTSKTTGMSIGKVSQLRKDLQVKGWLRLVEADGRMVYQVTIPGVADVQDVKSDVVEFHDMKQEFHTVKPKFHVVGALPLIGQKEDSPIKYITEPRQGEPLDSEREANRVAVEAVLALVDFWQDLTKRKRPASEQVFRETWFRPFNTIWLACGRDVDAAKSKIQAVRQQFIAQDMTIFDPSKLPAHVQTMIDKELIPMTERLNGNGHVNFKNDPMAREAHNRAVFAEVAREIESGEWSPWTINQ